MIFRIFKRRKVKLPSISEAVTNGWYEPQSSESLLNTEYRKKLLTLIWQQVAMTKEQFNEIYLKPIHRYAELVQLLPASRSHHHSQLGGMLDHGLEVVNFALKIRKGYLLPIGASTEEQSEQSEAWTAAVMYGALLHDIGKIIVDIDVQLASEKKWNPWNGKIEEAYRFKFIQNREYRLHPVAGAIICHEIISPYSLNWLSSYKELFSSLLYCISGHYEYAEVLGEIIQKADKASVSQNLGGDPTKALSKPQVSLSKQIIQALRYLVQNELRLNNSKTGSDGWLVDDVLWLVNKTVADKIRVCLHEQGITSIPHSNSKLFDELLAHNIVMQTEDGRAVWTCKVESNESDGICYEKMTLLKVSANVAWESIENRPDEFKGTVIPIIDKKVQSTTETVQNISNELVQETPKNEIANKTNENLDDFTLSLFSNNKSLNTDTIIENDLVVESNNNIDNPVNELNNNIPDTLPIGIKKTSTDININKLSEVSNDNECHSFIKWIRLSLLNGNIELNTPQAKIHTVENMVFLVSPGIFKQYQIEKNGNEKDWKELQKEFQKLKLHKKLADDGLNIWKCKVVGPRKSQIIKGYLIPNPNIILGQQVVINNPYLEILYE